MSFRWPALALIVSLAGWLLPFILRSGGGRGGERGVATPVWVIISFVVAVLALLAFIALLVAAVGLRRRE